MHVDFIYLCGFMMQHCVDDDVSSGKLSCVYLCFHIPDCGGEIKCSHMTLNVQQSVWVRVYINIVI